MKTRQLSLALAVFVLCAGGTSSVALAPQAMANPPEDDHAAAKHAEPPKESSKEPAKKTTKKAEAKAEGKGEGKAETKGESKGESKSEPSEKASKSESKAEGKGEAKSEEKAEPKGEAGEAKVEMTAEKALALLQEGNVRWVAGTPNNPASEPSRRALLAEQGQKPVATVLTCSDSRMPVERIFDRGVGEVFVVRVAGNVGGVDETGTIEYGVGHLKTPLLVVMGHTKCGAVAAAASGATLHGKVAELVAHISPAVERAKRNNPGFNEKDLPALAVRENVWQSIYDLMKNSGEIREAVAKKEVKVVGAVCDISTGKVEWLGEHPWQSEILDALNHQAAGPVHAEAVEEKH